MKHMSSHNAETGNTYKTEKSGKEGENMKHGNVRNWIKIYIPHTQCGPRVSGLNFLPLSYQRHLRGRDRTTELKRFLTRVQISVSVIAVVVKTERLALTLVVTLCQCREMDVKEEQHVAIKFCCKVDFSATKTVELIQKAYDDAALTL